MALYLVKSEMRKSQAKRERSQLGRRRKYLDEIAQCLLRLNVLLGYLREHDEQKSETTRTMTLGTDTLGTPEQVPGVILNSG